MGNVAGGIGSILVFFDQVKRYFRDVKVFPEIDKLIDIIQNSVPANSTVTHLDPNRALQYGNNSGALKIKHMDLVREKLFDGIRRNRVLVFNRDSASSIKGQGMARLSAIVTNNIRIIIDYSFDIQADRGKKGGLNKDTHTEEVPKCLCGKALTTLLQALNDLRTRFPQKRILSAKADVTDAFRNVRVTPQQTQNLLRHGRSCFGIRFSAYV